MISVNIYSIFFVCVFIEIYGYYEHRNKIFRCNDGEYIENDLFCSGEMVCNDKSDESYGCDKDCGQSRFKCKEGPCLNILVRCNTIKDCPDGSDELNCGDEVNVRNCSSKDGKFLCHDGRRCIGLEYTCDDYCNCFDCSDENSNCSKSDPSLVAKCPNSYFSTATGPTCLCGPNSSTNTSCNELKECDDHTCDHRCFQFKHRKQCSCYENFHELPGTNGMKCRSNTWYGGSVIYSTQLRIKSMNLTTNRTQLVRNGVNCTALGGAHDYIVYATQLQNNAKIFKTSITSKQTDLVTASDSLVISISVDYITRNIYFTTNTSLSVCSNDGRICTQMKCCSVKHVAVAPELGLMFYTQKINSQEEQYIMKANMDGTEESVLVDGVYSSIVTMAVDELTETLYWFDSGFKDKVEFISFDGEHKETWYTYFETKRHVFSLTVLENALLFTKKQENEIFIFRDLDIKEAEYSSYFHDNSSDVLKYLHAYNPQLQRTNEAMNPCSATSCKGLCLLRPASPTKGTRLSYTCLCDNFTATDGNHWCKSQNTSTSLHGIFAAENTPEISAKELNSCEFQLSKEHVLFVVSVIALVIIILALGSYFLIFRRYNWAEVISQQQYEPVYHRFFRCNNGKYIDQRWFCDGDMKDCGDGSEESFGCSPQKCGTARFTCYNDSSCVDITSRCNTLANCPDGSDEWFCGEETNIDECSLHKGKYRCRDNLKCIDFNYTCDGSCNCLDCSDEHTTNCAKFDSESCKTCPHYCLPTPNGPQCICNSSNYEMSKLCKEIENCTGSSDCEQHCTRYKNVTRCLCYEDHHEVFYPEGIKCRSNVWLENVLIYSTLTKIKALYVISNETQIIKNGVESDLLTAARRYIYYMIRVHNTYNIFKVSISGGEATKVTESDLPLTSIAVDWITNNVYFTTNQSLSVCSNDGRVCVQLQCCDVDYVTLAAQHGIMFFTKNSRGKVQQLIMRSNLDGSEKEALLDVSFHHPISLVADEWTKTLYWFELKTGRMYSSSFDASNKEMNDKILLNLGQVTSFIFSVLDREYFIVVNHTNRIHSVEGTRRYRDINTNTLRFLYAYNPTLQSTYEIENVCEKASCNGLCLLRSKPLTSDLDHSCLCEDAASKNGSQTCYIYNQMSSEGDKSPTESSLVVPPSTTSQPPCQGNFLKGIFYYIFSAVFIIGILAFYYVLCKINQNKRNQTINISERFEL